MVKFILFFTFLQVLPISHAEECNLVVSNESEKFVEDSLHVSQSLITKEKRSVGWRLKSGLHGRLADKLQRDGGAEQGNRALKSIKKSLFLDNRSKESAQIYAKIIVGITEKNPIVIRFIERAVEIDLEQEASNAINALKEAGVNQHPAIEKLEDYE